MQEGLGTSLSPKAVCAVLMNTPKAETINTRLEDIYAQNKAAIHFANIMTVT